MPNTTKLSRRSALAISVAAAAGSATAATTSALGANPIFAAPLSAAVTTPPAATAGGDADPILAIIKQHHEAERTVHRRIDEREKLEDELPEESRQTDMTRFYGWHRYFNGSSLLGGRVVETDDPRWLAAERAVWEAEARSDRAVTALLNTQPTTLAGLAAMLRYVQQYDASSGIWPEEAHRTMVHRAADALEDLLLEKSTAYT
jgi:hypothetical protein